MQLSGVGFGVMGFGFRGLWFSVFRFWVEGWGVEVSVLEISGCRFGVETSRRFWGLAPRVGSFEDFGFRDLGFGFRGFRFPVIGVCHLGLKVGFKRFRVRGGI